MRVPTRFAIALIAVVFAWIGCKPHDGKMLVTCVQGDVFLPSLHTCVWNTGEIYECEIASQTASLPDQRGDLLLCGAQTEMAWSAAWLRADIKSEVYKSARIQVVAFHSMGDRAGRGHPPTWKCKMSEIINCE